MAHHSTRRTAPRGSRAHSIISSTFSTPRATPGPPSTAPALRSTTRALRETSTPSDRATPPPEPARANKSTALPSHYTLAPTAPSPFTGTLEASLDALLLFGSCYTHTHAIVATLLQAPSSTTDWPARLSALYTAAVDKPAGRARYLLEELLFLATRTLLPEQIAENRLAMGRLYDRKKQLAIRVVLRYDMLREWKMEPPAAGVYRESAVAVASVPPVAGDVAVGVMPVAEPERFPYRRGLMPNVLATLVAAPEGGFTTHGVRERMRHHVTDLDAYLLLTDAEVALWSDIMLVGTTSQIVLQWQWLRQSNEILEEMESSGWEELEGKAEECEWIADDTKKSVGGKREKGKDDDGENE